MKAAKFNCEFKGFGVTNTPDVPNPDEFNYDESIITAFSFEDALSQWLRKVWDMFLSINIPYSPNDEVYTYGETYQDFIGSKDVEFNQVIIEKDRIQLEIRYRGRSDFWYEISILKH